MTHSLHIPVPISRHLADRKDSIPRKSHQKCQVAATTSLTSPTSLMFSVHVVHVGCTVSCTQFPPPPLSQVALCQVSQTPSSRLAPWKTLSVACPSQSHSTTQPNSAALGSLRSWELPHQQTSLRVKSQKCPWS